MIVVPLIHHNVAVGVIKVFASQPCAFFERDLRVLGLMSDLIAAAMFHAAKYGTDELFLKATRDGLTGLANRALFFDRLHHTLARARRDGRLMGVLMIDMDGLKPINDIHGHRAGDAAIREMAERIAADARQSDTVARLGGDEFAIVLSVIESRAGAEQACSRIAERAAEPFSFEGRSLPLGASIGLALFPEDGELPDVLVEKADQAMYAVKRTRKSTRV